MAKTATPTVSTSKSTPVPTSAPKVSGDTKVTVGATGAQIKSAVASVITDSKDNPQIQAAKGSAVQGKATTAPADSAGGVTGTPPAADTAPDSGADTSSKTDDKALSVTEDNRIVAFHEKLNDPALTAEEKIKLYEDHADILSVEEKKTLEDLKKQKDNSENDAGGNKGKGPGVIGTHNADETDEDDEKFKIQEGDIIDYLMKEVILASADYVGNKVCKLAGGMICCGLSGSWNCAVSSKDWVCETIKERRRKAKEREQYPTDVTGSACRDVDEITNRYAKAAISLLSKEMHPWENNNKWDDEKVGQQFVQNLKEGKLVDVAILPPIRTKDDIKSAAHLAEGQVISDAFRSELCNVMAVVGTVNGVPQDKLDKIKAAAALNDNADTKRNALKNAYSALTDDEKAKYNEALAGVLKDKVGNVDDYAAKKIREQSEVQHSYNQNKTDKYYESIASAHTKEGLDFLQDTFHAKPATGKYSKHVVQMQEAVGEIVKTGKSEKEAWEACAKMMDTQNNLAASQCLFAAEYATAMITQKYLTDKNYRPRPDDLRADIDKYTKEGRVLHKFGVANGTIDELRDDLAKARSNQNNDLMNRRYAEKDAEPKTNKPLDRIKEVRDFIKKEDDGLLKGGLSLREEADAQNRPMPEPSDRLQKIDALAKDWKERRDRKNMQTKANYMLGVTGMTHSSGGRS